MRKVTSLLCTLSILFCLVAPTVNSASVNPKALLEKKYPRERVTVSKSVDLNGDNKKEHLLITDSGNFYLINSKSVIVLISKNVISDDELDFPAIHIYQVSKKEKHVAVTYNYFPSNTQLDAYKYKDGTLQRKLSIMGDQGVKISNKGVISQYWKNFYPEGGWKLAIATYTWSSTKNKYIGSGELPR
ncbi:hypothetical protein [Paenibacillus pabuli]|uniref:hypothetical protein n=1 Tax=Paenibacillus pabuli TaxID=1472 RepID=UPI000780907C|nr:hypothetical protein [Paenibacillus pabuli]MEC0127157.1 hypothetical protein [Paenibacillus pabuli]